MYHSLRIKDTGCNYNQFHLPADTMIYHTKDAKLHEAQYEERSVRGREKEREKTNKYLANHFFPSQLLDLIGTCQLARFGALSVSTPSFPPNQWKEEKRHYIFVLCSPHQIPVSQKALPSAPTAASALCICFQRHYVYDTLFSPSFLHTIISFSRVNLSSRPQELEQFPR